MHGRFFRHRRGGVEFTEDDLKEAKRQIDSILHNLRETVKKDQSI